MFVTNGKGNIIRLLAGIFILLSLALAQWVSPYWLLFTAFVGVNLIISSLTGFCLLEKILVKLGVKEQGSSSCGL
ncbi:YgaP family membrane protein [Brevibacillus sp. SYSU BS000544]|uniref:YgaP family membrane protein n=1 Tax=Brevibacillus sp. SYSU BS000544 TaxID=3416443 RepID=UPI003CE50EDC